MDETELLTRRVERIEQVLSTLLENQSNPHEPSRLSDIDDAMFKARRVLDADLDEMGQVPAKIG